MLSGGHDDAGSPGPLFALRTPATLQPSAVCPAKTPTNDHAREVYGSAQTISGVQTKELWYSSHHHQNYKITISTRSAGEKRPKKKAGNKIANERVKLDACMC